MKYVINTLFNISAVCQVSPLSLVLTLKRLGGGGSKMCFSEKRGGGWQFDPPPEKTTFKKPSLIRVKRVAHYCSFHFVICLRFLGEPANVEGELFL